MTETFIYHLARQAEWDAASKVGVYRGSADDTADGFLHFSTAAQIVESAARHRAGERGLLLLRARTAELGEALRWEPSRGGALFPHLYGALPVAAVVSVDPLPVGEDGRHVFPDLT
ncbi:MAG: DUF952 domain-containing protein [Planctomycetota bacterium]